MKHVRAVATLLIVQGICEFVVGVSLLSGMQTLPGQAADESKGQILAVLLLALGVVMLGCGILKIFAGVRNRKLRNRGLGFAALISAVPAVFTCWCAPTGLAIMVYGLIAYTRPEGRAAFDAGETSIVSQSLGLR